MSCDIWLPLCTGPTTHIVFSVFLETFPKRDHTWMLFPAGQSNCSLSYSYAKSYYPPATTYSSRACSSEKFASRPEGATAIMVRLVIPLNQCSASPFMWALKDLGKSATSWRPKSKMNRLPSNTSQLWMKNRCPATFWQGDSLPGLLRGVTSDEVRFCASAPHTDWDVALAQIRLNGPTV